MPHVDAYHAVRWFGLPGLFMAGILCGALIAAIGYSRHGTASPAVERHMPGWFDEGSERPSRHPRSSNELVVKPVRTVSI